MKKLFALLLCCFTVLHSAAFAEGEEDAAECSSVTVVFELDRAESIIADTAVFCLAADGREYYASAFADPMADGVTVTFETEPYAVGSPMTLTLVSGADGMRYYDTVYGVGEAAQMYTYRLPEDGSIVNSFCMTLYPKHRFRVDMYKDYERMELTQSAYVDGDTCMVPVIEVAKALGLEAYYDDRYRSVYVGIGDKEVLFNLDTVYATVLGEDVNLPAEPVFVGWTVMAPLRTLTDAFGCEVVVQDEGAYYNINLGRSQAVKEYEDIATKAYKVNGIGSRTSYLIWVSKYEYTVRVYEGQKGEWKLIRSCPCAIGAPSTPTITGQFEYIEKQAYWDYGSYYCGPIMRFYNGYALHSTLQYWNGGAYDGRVGMMISHGCVRMHPADINWLAANIPLHTRIYITN